jgi:hypothetical protein
VSICRLKLFETIVYGSNRSVACCATSESRAFGSGAGRTAAPCHTTGGIHMARFVARGTESRRRSVRDTRLCAIWPLQQQ